MLFSQKKVSWNSGRLLEFKCKNGYLWQCLCLAPRMLGNGSVPQHHQKNDSHLYIRLFEKCFVVFGSTNARQWLGAATPPKKRFTSLYSSFWKMLCLAPWMLGNGSGAKPHQTDNSNLQFSLKCFVLFGFTHARQQLGAATPPKKRFTLLYSSFLKVFRCVWLHECSAIARDRNTSRNRRFTLLHTMHAADNRRCTLFAFMHANSKQT